MLATLALRNPAFKSGTLRGYVALNAHITDPTYYKVDRLTELAIFKALFYKKPLQLEFIGSDPPITLHRHTNVAAEIQNPTSSRMVVAVDHAKEMADFYQKQKVKLEAIARAVDEGNAINTQISDLMVQIVTLGFPVDKAEKSQNEQRKLMDQRQHLLKDPIRQLLEMSETFPKSIDQLLVPLAATRSRW